MRLQEINQKLGGLMQASRILYFDHFKVYKYLKTAHSEVFYFFWTTAIYQH